jgi:hypothetical protein
VAASIEVREKLSWKRLKDGWLSRFFLSGLGPSTPARLALDAETTLFSRLPFDVAQGSASLRLGKDDGVVNFIVMAREQLWAR